MIGFALFGALTYLPLFQQVVRGDSPTESGLQLIPVMAGVLHRLDRLGPGRSPPPAATRSFPIAGTAIAAIGMLLLSRLDAGTSTLYAFVAMFVHGPRARPGHAGARARRAERRRLRRARRRDLGRHAVPLDGRLARYGRARRDLHQPAHRRARGLAGGPGRQRLDRPQRGAAAPGRGPRRLHGRLHRRALDRLPRRRGDRRWSPSCCRGCSRSARCARRSTRPGWARPSPRRRAATRCTSSRASSPAWSAASAPARSSSAPSTPPASTSPPGAAWLLVQGQEGVELHDPEAIAADRPIDAAGCASSVDLLAEPRAGRRRRSSPTPGHATAERLIDARRDCLSSLIADWQPDDDPRVNDAIARLAARARRRRPRPRVTAPMPHVGRQRRRPEALIGSAIQA